MRLTSRLPSFSPDGSWRKIFSKSSKHLDREIMAVSYSSTNVAIPPIHGPPAVTTSTYQPSNYYPVSTHRASSEYASSIGGPPDDIDFELPSSPSSATSSWNQSTIPDSPTSSKRYSYSAPSRPISLFSHHTTRFQATDGIEEEPATSMPDALDGGEAGSSRPDRLVLTMTSKYPTGTAADMYTPVDVALRARPSVARRLSSRVRPASMLLLSRPSLPSRPGSSRRKRASVASASQIYG